MAGIMAALQASLADASSMPVAFGQTIRRDGSEVTYPVPQADGAVIDLDQEVILVRWTGSIYAFNLSCPHQNTALKWQAADQRFKCPRHKSEYHPDGTFIQGRATRGMDRFAIRKSEASVVVNLEALYRNDRDAAAWAAATVPA
jgi:Rieske Fe-S protein